MRLTKQEIKAETMLKRRYRNPKNPADPADLLQRCLNIMHRELATLKQKYVLNGSEAKTLTAYMQVLISLNKELRAQAQQTDVSDMSDEELTALAKKAQERLEK